MSVLTKGRRVHYAFKGECYIADVVKVWTPPLANLVLTLDGMNDRVVGGDLNVFQVWKTSIDHDEEKSDRTWHWPERTE